MDAAPHPAAATFSPSLRRAQQGRRRSFATIANRPVLIWGVPALVLYLFAVWAAIVAVLIAAAVRRRGLEDDE